MPVSSGPNSFSTLTMLISGDNLGSCSFTLGLKKEHFQKSEIPSTFLHYLTTTQLQNVIINTFIIYQLQTLWYTGMLRVPYQFHHKLNIKLLICLVHSIWITSSNFHDLKHISAYNSVQLTLYPGAALWERLSLRFLLYWLSVAPLDLSVKHQGT